MPFKIALRTDKSFSHFKRYLAELITLPAPAGTEHSVVITNAYFENGIEHEPGSKGSLIQLLSSHCTNGKLVIISAGRGAARPTPRRLLRLRWRHVVKYKISRRSGAARVWAREIDAFLGEVYKAISASPIEPIEIRQGGWWHAKVALRVIDGNVAAALIGSSNLTKAAFSEVHGYFNNECDILLWPSSRQRNTHFFGHVVRQRPFRPRYEPPALKDPDYPRDDEFTNGSPPRENGGIADAEYGDDGIEIFGQTLGEGAAVPGVAVESTQDLAAQLNDLYSDIIANTKLVV